MATNEKPAGGGIPQAGCGIAADTANHSPFRARVEALAATLLARWPAAFAEPLRPLAVGIHEQIAAALALDEAGRRTLRDALARHTRRPCYLKAVLAGRSRANLDGSDAGAPEARHIEHAREVLSGAVARREAEAQRAANKAAKAAAAALRKAAANLTVVPKPAPKPEARTKPTVIVRKRRRIEGGRL